tara:strand:- start:325 stop:480 length:156 start_codon:yes stop_codon:yes gene_type:complete
MDALNKIHAKKGTLVDVILAVGDKVIMKYLHNLTQITIGFSVAQKLETLEV